jgi:uncharacterized Zn-binding protein involved in type VI secretion
MPPAARISDMHVCPMVTGVVPHVGGPIMSGFPTVLIGFMPAARVTDVAICVGPPDMIAMGSPTVLIGNMMAARIGDPTAHGGIIVMGFPTVIIGEVGMGGAGAASPSMKPPSKWLTFKVWLWNLFHGPDHQRETYSDGIVIEGTPAFRAQTRAALNQLAGLPSGNQLLTQINNSGHEVVIRETTDDNGYCSADNASDAQTPGVGTDSVVQWNPNHNTTDPADPVSGSPGSTVILGHELVHANHNANGTNGNGPYDSYPGQSGSSGRGEERATVGAGGTSVTAPDGTVQAVPDHSGDSPTENSIRDDMGIPRRPTYYPSNWPGGAPW